MLHDRQSTGIQFRTRRINIRSTPQLHSKETQPCLLSSLLNTIIHAITDDTAWPFQFPIYHNIANIAGQPDHQQDCGITDIHRLKSYRTWQLGWSTGHPALSKKRHESGGGLLTANYRELWDSFIKSNYPELPRTSFIFLSRATESYRATSKAISRASFEEHRRILPLHVPVPESRLS